MIKINDKLYTDYQIKVTWGNFEASLKNGKKNTGLAPSIIFYIDKSPIIELELTYSKEMFLKISINNKTNITKYVSDINIKNKNHYLHRCANLIFNFK